MRKAFIYYIYCEVSKRVYIGSTCRTVPIRISEHFSKLRKNKHGNKHLQHTFNKYNKLTHGIIQECTIENVYEIEEHYIKITKSYNKKMGFNKGKVAKNPHIGVKKSEKLKKQISEKLKGRPSPMKGLKNPKAKENIKKAIEATSMKIINTNTLKVYKSIADFCRSHNISNSAFFKSKKRKTVKGISWDYYKEGKTYKKLKTPKRHGRWVRVKNNNTGKIYESLVAVSKELSIDPIVLKKRIQKGVKINGHSWRIL